MAVEHAPQHRRGFYGAWPQVGVPAGLVLGTGAYAVLSATLSDEQFLAWGWRVPFLASALLIAVGLWIRLTVAESPVFQQALDEKASARMPVLDALRTYRPGKGQFLAWMTQWVHARMWTSLRTQMRHGEYIDAFAKHQGDVPKVAEEILCDEAIAE
jgi:MFS family permease